MFLIKFQYENFCQGYEWVEGIVFVKNVLSFSEAIDEIKKRYRNAKDFEDLTIG